MNHQHHFLAFGYTWATSIPTIIATYHPVTHHILTNNSISILKMFMYNFMSSLCQIHILQDCKLKDTYQEAESQLGDVFQSYTALVWIQYILLSICNFGSSSLVSCSSVYISSGIIVIINACKSKYSFRPSPWSPQSIHNNRSLLQRMPTLVVYHMKNITILTCTIAPLFYTTVLQ
jgi:hypothetical protein